MRGTDHYGAVMSRLKDHIRDEHTKRDRGVMSSAAQVAHSDSDTSAVKGSASS